MGTLPSLDQRRFLPLGYGGIRKSREYTESMAVLELHERYQSLVEELLAEVESYNPTIDRDLLTRAFLFAAEAHDGQQRRSGEDFVHHPYGVASILAGLKMDSETIAAALLHDVVEDTGVDIDAVRSEF